MDEIDSVVDNLFGRYIPKNKDVAPVPSEPLPSSAPEPEADADATGSQAAHPDIIRKPTEPHPDIIKKAVKKEPASIAEPEPAAKSVKPAAKPDKKPEPARKKTAKPQESVPAAKTRKTNLQAVSVDIAEIKKQTARLLRHLHKAIKSENWWHRLYYANKFLMLAVSISKTITRRPKSG